MTHDQFTLGRVQSIRQDAPCVSIYFRRPDGRLAQEVPSIGLYREFSYARGLLESSMSPKMAADYLKPLWLIATDELTTGLSAPFALFKSGDVSACIRLQEDVAVRTVVADDFHVKPIIKSAGQVEDGSHQWALTLCQRALREGRALTSLYDVAQALRSGKAQCLWVAEDVTLWGILNRRYGSVLLHPRQLNDRDGDVLDDLAEWAMEAGIDVHVLPKHQIPGQHMLIAEI